MEATARVVRCLLNDLLFQELELELGTESVVDSSPSQIEKIEEN